MTVDFSNALTKQAQAWGALLSEQARSFAKLQNDLITKLPAQVKTPDQFQANLTAVGAQAFDFAEAAVKLAQAQQSQALDLLAKNEMLNKVAPDAIEQLRDITTKGHSVTNDVLQRARASFSTLAKATPQKASKA